MESVRMYIPSELLYGQNALDQLGSTAARHGKRILLLSEPILQDSGALARVQSELESRALSCLVYPEINSEQEHAAIEEAIQIGTAGKVQLVVSLGGMRVAAAGRIAAAAIAARSKASELPFEQTDPLPCLPCIEIPTAIRNPFQLQNSCIAGLAESRLPQRYRLTPGFLKALIVDPHLTLGLSGKTSAAIVVDSILSGIEAYISLSAGFIGRPLAIEGIRLCSEAVLGVFNTPDGLRPRMKACEGSLLISLALSSGSQGLGGALVYAMSSMFSVPKSWVAAILAPHVAEYWIPVVPREMALLAGAMGTDVSNLPQSEAARLVPQTLRRMIGQTELPGRLRDLGIELSQAQEAAEVAMQMPMLRECPRFPQAADLMNLVKRAY
ncbi:iron-containing alcohol dehydrogenase [Spirochaeta dissipatitropha]